MASNGLKDITDANFEEITGNGVTLVDFWAPWCYPCRIQGPILEKVKDKIGGDVEFCKMNVDENMQTPGKFGITGIPTLIIFKDGQPAKQMVGVQDESTLVQTLQTLI